MRRHVMLLVSTVLCLTEVPPLAAQIEARQGVARLPWHDPNAGGIRGTVMNFDALWRPNFHADHFMAGWNWGASERELSEPLVMPVHHIGDEWITDLGLRNAYQRRHLPGRVLIPRLRGLGTLDDLNIPGIPNERDLYRCPNESIALEFVPFLVWDQATEHMTLVASDATGSVFGFREHALGVTVPALPTPQTTPQPQPGSVDYRWRLEATQVTGRTPVLSDVWPDRELRVFGNTAGGQNNPRDNHNTTEMFVSVTVRRTSDANPVDEAAHANDEVLRITIPYWMGVIDGAQITGNIRFRWLTRATDPVNDHVVEGVVVGRRRIDPLADLSTGPATEEFIITRGMLPLAALNQDVTIEARFTSDWDEEVIANGGLDEANRPNPWSNPRFYSNELDPASADAPDRISRYDVNVEYAGSVDIEIKSVRLETAAARDLFWGDLDDEIVGEAPQVPPNPNRAPGAILQYFQDLEARNAWLTAPPQTGNADATGRVASVWKFYGRDEIMPMHWKSFRYINRLLEGHLTTEVNIRWSEGMRHSLGLRELWQGATNQSASHVASYAFERGFRADPNYNDPLLRDATRRRYMGLERGRTPHGDPDLLLGGFSGALPLTPQQQTTMLTPNSEGIQAHQEHYLNHWIRPEREMLFSTDAEHHWFAQVWQYSSWLYSGTTDLNPANISWLEAKSNARPKTCGEYRAQFWSSLVLGTHGLVLYHGSDVSTDGFPLPDPAPLPQPPATVPINVVDAGFQTGTLNLNQAPPLPTPEEFLNADATGSDWLIANDPTNMDAWLTQSVQQTANNFAGVPNGPNVLAQIYLGRRAMRQVTREVLGRLDAATRQTLCSLKLRGWHARGFRRVSTSRESATEAALLAERLEIRADAGNRLLTRPVGRVTLADPTTTNPGQPMWEAIDSSFVDVTLLSHLDDMDMSDGFYVGVFNRRTNPMMAIPRGGPPAFHLYNDLLTEWNTHPERLYDQQGAREVRLPFTVPHDATGRYRLLHVTELGTAPAGVVGNRPLSRPPLDTMIGQDGDLNLTLMPGEGRIYRVEFAAAEQDLARGWLDHNTQRKMVVHPDVAMGQPPLPPGPIITTVGETKLPCINDDGTGEVRTIDRVQDGATWRYHMVYHRRQLPPAVEPGADTGPLSVFYRRSHPLTNVGSGTNDLEDGQITWEPEILINDHFNPPGEPPSVPSCGYPSIVVRYDSTRLMNMVYIVYACETAETLPNQNVLIAEAQFPADIPNQDAWYHAPLQGSRVLDYVMSSGIDNNNRLHHWGTPVINASYLGNFYAWSDHQRGIVYGYKLPAQLDFPPGGLNQMRAITQINNQPWVAKYPTMHSYSRIRAGEVDASLAWQEGPDVNNGIGRAIMYTRLRANVLNNAVEHFLTIAPPPVTPQTLVQNNGLNWLFDQQRILSVAQRDIGTNGSNERPTLLRMLSDFPDESMSAASPLFAIGHVNHKPDRIVWEHTYHNPTEGPRWPTDLAHRAIDFTDMCLAGGNGVFTNLWTTPEAWITDRDEADLVQPELSHGEMKTELHVNAQTHPQYVPPSWDYDDSTLVLGFAAVAAGARHGALYQLMYGFDLYGSEVDVLLPSTGLSQRAIVRRLTHDGRSPHAPARHNVVHAQRIFKGRRIYESDDANEQAGAWARAPVMTRTNEGFFKRIDTYRDGDVPTRKWQGFAGEDGFATVTDLELDGATLSLRRVNDAGRGTPRRPGPQQYAGEWVTIDDVSTLDMESFASQGDVLVTVYVERERDGQRVPFAYFNGRQKQRWQLIPDPTERYRIVIENVDEDLGFVTDLEISHEAGDLGRYADADDQLLDLRRIGLGMSATSAATLEVWPQPARDVVTMLARCSMTTTPAVLTIRDVRGEGVMRLPCKSIDLIRIPTSTMPTGSYMATIEAEGRVIGRTMFQIIR